MTLLITDSTKKMNLLITVNKNIFNVAFINAINKVIVKLSLFQYCLRAGNAITNGREPRSCLG